MNNGWIKMHRKIINKGWYKKSDHKSVWYHLLLKANHQDNEFWFNGKNIIIKKGQFVTGRKKLSFELGISESKIERILKFFEKSEHQIEQQKTNKNRLITILNWSEYQSSEHQIEQPVNNQRTTSEQPVNTNKKEENVENVKNEKKKDIDFLIQYLNQVTGKDYKITTKEYRGILNARLKIYSVNELQKVIDIKFKDPFFIEKDLMNIKTLFGSDGKVETYLNWKPKKQKEYTTPEEAEAKLKIMEENEKLKAEYTEIIGDNNA